MPTPQQTHVFFDTTEVKNPKPLSGLGRIANPELGAAAKAIGARLHVTDLVVEEIAYQRLSAFKEKYRNASLIKPYVPVGDEPDNELLLEKFRAEIRTALSEASVTIIPTSFTLEQVLALLEVEKSRLNKKRPMGLKDAAILLSSLKYARANGMRECWFVSHDDGFEGNVVKDVAAKDGITCRLIKTVGEATQLMKELRAANISSLQAALATAALALVNRHLGVIQEYLEAHPLALDDVRPFVADQIASAVLAGTLPVPISFGPGNPIRIASVAVARIHAALPDAQPAEGSACSLTFHGSVSAQVRVLSPARSSPYYGSFFYGPYGSIGGGEIPFTVDQVSMPIVGKARANFKGGDFVEPLSIESVIVGPAPEAP